MATTQRFAPTICVREREVDEMISRLTRVILNLERFVNENEKSNTDGSLREAMNLTAAALGKSKMCKNRFETIATHEVIEAGYWKRG